jgi:hypothetical protein
MMAAVSGPNQLRDVIKRAVVFILPAVAVALEAVILGAHVRGILILSHGQPST